MYFASSNTVLFQPYKAEKRLISFVSDLCCFSTICFNQNIFLWFQINVKEGHVRYIRKGEVKQSCMVQDLTVCSKVRYSGDWGVEMSKASINTYVYSRTEWFTNSSQYWATWKNIVGWKFPEQSGNPKKHWSNYGTTRDQT